MKQGSYPSVRFVKNESIDKARWNLVVEQSANFRVYALTWYLDRVSEGWDALVWGDYEYLMPLTRRRKWGITYLTQPCYAQQLGVFPPPPASVLEAFLISVRERFRYCSININSQNNATGQDGLEPKVNLVLNLNFPYTGLYSQYSGNHWRHLKKASENHLTFTEGIHTGDYIEFKTRNQTPKLYSTCLPTFKRLSAYLLYEGKATIYGVYNAENELCAAAFFVFHGKRIVYLNGVSSTSGRNVDAMYYLLDRVIQFYAGTTYFLDFEGSMIPGIASFFKGFGAQAETYYQLKYNHLPFPLKWLKR